MYMFPITILPQKTCAEEYEADCNSSSGNSLPADAVFRDHMCVGGDASSFLFNLGCEGRMPAELSTVGNAARHAERVHLQP